MKTLLSYEDLTRMGVTMSVQQLAKLEAVDKFPRRVSLGPRTFAWVSREIKKHLGRK
jgi:predicted DNA-binding transcriptional regulator AlpA